MSNHVPNHVVKARPRIGAVGFRKLPEDLQYIKATAGTLYIADSISGLAEQVHDTELDLLILNEVALTNLSVSTHTISFGSFTEGHRPYFTADHGQSLHIYQSTATRHEYAIDKSLHPALTACVNTWANNHTSARGLICVVIDEDDERSIMPSLRDTHRKAREPYLKAGLIHSPNHDYQLACVLIRPNKKGLALLPAVNSSRRLWIDAVLQSWAEADPSSFPVLGEWQKQPPWMTLEELSVHRRIEELAQEERAFLAKLENERQELNESLTLVRKQADSGARRLLTTQSGALTEAVALALKDLGFEVSDQDAQTKPGAPKYEDLRISRPDQNWEALVEVKGYSKGAGKTSDFHDIHRHLSHYQLTTGKDPAKIFYIVNVEFERTTPDRRSIILPGADEDVEKFAEHGGVCMSTVDLFRLHRDREALGREKVFELFRTASGRFLYSGLKA